MNTMTTSRPADTYSPTYFLASVGNGGIAITFFMYLLFWVPHPGRTVPNFEDISAAWQMSAPQRSAIVVAMAGIAIYTAVNLYMLHWNVKSYLVYRKSPAYEALRKQCMESTLLTVPLALAMSVNVTFIFFLVFIPTLWSGVEYIFPIALSAFGIIAVHAFRLLGEHLSRVLVSGDEGLRNSYAQVTPAFALAMIAVGFSAPAAMSSNPSTVGASVVLSTFVGTASLIYGSFAAISGFGSMLHHGIPKEGAPTLMIIIPIITTLAIMFMRQDHGLHTTYDTESTSGEIMIFLARMLAAQISFLLIGITVLIGHGYHRDYVLGSKTHPASYALVCPFVALSVMIHFFVNKGLVAAGAVPKYGGVYWFVTAVAIVMQLIAMLLASRLNMQHFSASKPHVEVKRLGAGDIEAPAPRT